MSTSTPADLQSSATTDRIAGPIMTADAYGNRYSYYRCTRCGAESDRRRDLSGCCQR